MCGVVSIVYPKNIKDLGEVGALLLKKLEYRGYDSTGAAFFKKEGSVTLKKKVGSPTKVVQELEIDKFTGYKFIGQVRWATYGAVTDKNAQPHDINCLYHFTGAHNGNISNTDTIKEFLLENSHDVVSDNDGEMLVHMIEHFYVTKEAKQSGEKLDNPLLKGYSSQIKQFLSAIRLAHKKIKGSYAACVTAEGIDGVFAIKAGSSLYAGKGSDHRGDFIVVSSDLTSVLAKTRFLIPLNEGEGIYFTDNQYFVFSLNENRKNGENEYIPELKRSKLNVQDISLNTPYNFFMEQEIFTTNTNIDNILQYYFSDEIQKIAFSEFEKHRDTVKNIVFEFLKLNNIFDYPLMEKEVKNLMENDLFRDCKKQLLVNRGIREYVSNVSTGFVSDEKALIKEILGVDEKYYQDLLLIDLMIVWKKKRKILGFKEELIKTLKQRDQASIYLIGAGTSYHASLIGSYFFNEIAGRPIVPVNPGGFRSQYMNSLRKNDILIFITQSGETKDLVDIINDVRNLYGNEITVVSIVNNENSTIPQEKSSYYLPILCGPEIAVAATKSFTNQILIFYILANELVTDDVKIEKKVRKIKSGIEFVLKNINQDINSLADDIYLAPSIHILASSLIGIANEGALKIREVVINHTQGFDAAEFKHGPNTILGKNTIFSLESLENIAKSYIVFMKESLQNMDIKTTRDEMFKFLNLMETSLFKPININILGGNGNHSQNKENTGNHDLQKIRKLYDNYYNKTNIENSFSNYPLIFICPPDERDKRITISQIHTHKIRGANIFLIAQEDEELEKAVMIPPAEARNYQAQFIKLPSLDDKNLFVFQSAVIVQLLAFHMSVKKMKYLNSIKIENHGVHPDVPKNVSKSITVD